MRIFLGNKSSRFTVPGLKFYQILLSIMKKIYLMFMGLIILSLSTVLFAQENPKAKGLEAITKEAVQGQLQFLSSDWTQGRGTGTPGEYMAADYIVSIFKIYGLQPGGDFKEKEISRRERFEGKIPEKYRTFYQDIDFVEYTNGENNEFSILSGPGKQVYNFNYRTDFDMRTSDVGIEIDAPVVFVGYGYVNKEKDYDDFKGVDVKNKIVLCLSGYPGSNDTTSIAYKTFANRDDRGPYRRFVRKDRFAIEKGALAIIEVDPSSDPAEDWAANLPFRYNERMYEGVKAPSTYYNEHMKIPGDTISNDLTTIYISRRVLTELLKGTDINLTRFADEVKNTLKPAPKEIPGKKVHLKTSVNSRIIKARNVIGMIPGKDTTKYVVIGGHYDHLGTYNGIIWNGADDNASGTVGMMTIAKAFIASGIKPEKNILFCAWTGEEKGLLGSTYFTDHLPVAYENISMYLNYDMISRDDADDTLGVKCSLMYTEGNKYFEDNTKKYNEEYSYGLNITYRSSARPGGGSDHAPFARKNIPIIYFMAGFPPQYHQADDHVELVNFDKMVKIIKLGYLNVWDAAVGGN
jgi:hypothetical protein